MPKKKTARKRKLPENLAELASDPGNPRIIEDDAAVGLDTSMKEFGDIGGITFNTQTGELVSGHQRVQRLRNRYGDDLVIQHDGNGTAHIKAGRNVWPVRLVKWTRQKQKAANVAANSREISGEFTEALQLRLVEIAADTPDLYESLLLDRLATVEAEEETPPEDPDVEPSQKLVNKWKVKKGQVWEVHGNRDHLVICGDSTHESIKAVVRESLEIDTTVLLTDPPYCSGGYQESGKSTGSVGRRDSKDKIARDTLSTRGYKALMKAMVELAAGVPCCYVFTDWKMWANLFDVTEADGFGVRNMIIWNKGTPGLGRGWRMQHELILFGTKTKLKFGKSLGNVIECKRSGNKHHQTEKPVDLLCAILDVTDMCGYVLDPFLGSGSTLLAADRMQRSCHGIELETKYVAAALERAAQVGMECQLTEESVK